MEFFKKIVNILFGTQKEYAVKDLGIFHSKVCDWWQNRFYPEAIESSVKYNNSWKITFTTDDLDYSFSIIWENNTVRDLTLS